MKTPKLTIELVPSPNWYTNVRSNVSKEEWDEIRYSCYKKADHKCEICGDVGTNQGYLHKVECHEIWHYDDEKKIQKLVGFISLCPKCHKVKHIGRAKISNDYDMCVEHLKKVNNWSKTKTKKYIDEMFDLHSMRSMYNWKLDISFIDTYVKPNDLNEIMRRFNKK